MIAYLPLLLGLLVGVIEYISRKLDIIHKPYAEKIISFSAGVSVTYLLLELLPLYTEAAFVISKLLFIAVLLGFIIHHLVEKEIYQHNRKHQLIKKLSLEENSFYFIYHIILGIVLVTFARQNIIQGLFFFASILAYTIVSNLPSGSHKSNWRLLLLSSSTFLGTLIGIFLWVNIPLWLEYSLVGLAAGVLLFTITRHHVPFGRKGSISYFVLGFLLFMILIMINWYL